MGQRKNELLSGAIWSIAGYAVMAIFGIIFNVIISNHYGVAALGVFNQAYAFYIILSMVIAFGIQLSSLHHVALFLDRPDVLKSIITSGLIILTFWGCFVILVSYFLSPLIGYVFKSTSLEKAFIWVLPGIYFFGLNKYLLNTINALIEIKKMAILQSLRFIFANIFLLVIIFNNLSMVMITSCLSFSEFLIFLISLVIIRPHLGSISYTLFKKWVKRHLFFGCRAFSGGIVSEANTRIDIFMLGLFLNDKLVGIYSVAALAAEGLLQVVDVLRFPFNPHLSKGITENKKQLEKLIKKGVLSCYSFVIVLVLLAYLFFEPLIDMIFNSPDLHESKTIFYVFLVGILISGGYRAFMLLLSQAGLPGKQTMFMILVTCSNILLNFIMIPLWGTIGAATATSTSWILQMLYLKFFAKKNIQISI